jgi:hypothetical protein
MRSVCRELEKEQIVLKIGIIRAKGIRKLKNSKVIISPKMYWHKDQMVTKG